MGVKQPQPVGVQAGDTFLVTNPYNHLYVVCSDPALDPTRVLIVRRRIRISPQFL